MKPSQDPVKVKLNYLLPKHIGLVLLLLPYFATADYQRIDKIAAIVDDKIILQTEFDEKILNLKAQYKDKSHLLPPDEILEKQILERLILEKIQLQLADRMGIRIDDDTLNREIQKIAYQNGLSLEQFRKNIEKSGMPYSSIREEIRTEIRITGVRERHVANRIRVTDQEVDRFITSTLKNSENSSLYHLKHILIALDRDSKTKGVKEKEKRADKIYMELKNGADFHKMALKYSDANDALEGGDLGWRSASQLPTLFANTAAQLQIGDISKPLKAGNGFHILKMENMKGQKNHLVNQKQVRHILIQPSAILTSEQAKVKLKNIKNQINQGADFSEMAKQHSDDPGSANKGGDLGWVGPGEMVSIFDQIMNSSPVNLVSPLFESQFGWHILEVLAEREQDVTDQMKINRAKSALHKRKYEEELELWLRKIRQEAFVEIKA